MIQKNCLRISLIWAAPVEEARMHNVDKLQKRHIFNVEVKVGSAATNYDPTALVPCGIVGHTPKAIAYRATTYHLT
jgi:hypothetical protein